MQTTHLPKERGSCSIYTPVPETLWWGLFLGAENSPELSSASHRHRAALRGAGKRSPQAPGYRCWQLEGAGFGRSGWALIMSATGCQVWLCPQLSTPDSRQSHHTASLIFWNLEMKRQSVSSSLLLRSTISHYLNKPRLLWEKGGQPKWRRAFCWVLTHNSSCLKIQLSPPLWVF